MLAEPEYSSPPNEVCCWPGRRDRAGAGRERRGIAATGKCAAAKSHREDAAGLNAAAEHHREDAAGRAPWRKLLARAAGGTAGENSQQQQPGNGHLTEQARSVNLTKQAQGAILAELVRLSFWQRRCVGRSGREKGINKKAASRRVSKLAA